MDTVKVYPPEPVSEQTIKLSVCDAYSPKVWVMQAHFWPLRDSLTPERASQLLQEGLGRTIAEVPSLAGTVAHGPSDDPRDLVISVAAGAHVDFSTDDFSGKDDIPSYLELEAQGFPLTNLMIPFSPQITLAPVSAGAPMLAVKLNLLKGGVALSFGFNHLLADAGAIAEVERIWAMHTADVSSGMRQTHRTQTPDVEIRKRLSTPQPNAGEFEDVHWKEFPTSHSQLNLPREAVSIEAALAIIQQSKRTQLEGAGADLEETKWAMWYFSPEKLAKLKANASGPDETQWISTMDALIGLFWSQLIPLRLQDGDGQEVSSLLFPINIRQRLQPSIHPQYIGNAVDITFAECSLSQLCETSGLLTAAQCVRKAVKGWSLSAWEAWLTKAVSLPADKAICPNALFLLSAHNMAFNDYSKSQSHTLDWGSELGQIARTRYMKPAASLANCACAVIVYPRLADGGLEVALSCNERVRRALESNELFQAYGKLVCISA